MRRGVLLLKHTHRYALFPSGQNLAVLTPRFSIGAGSLPPDLQGCGQNMTPTCYRAMYQIPSNVKAVPGNSLGLYEQGDYFAESDIDSFFASFAPWVPQGTFPIPALIDGAEYSVPADDTTLDGGEADIDIDIA